MAVAATATDHHRRRRHRLLSVSSTGRRRIVAIARTATIAALTTSALLPRITELFRKAADEAHRPVPGRQSARYRPRALGREARAIQVELERSGFRDRFEARDPVGG
jgi:hypothetical protein